MKRYAILVLCLFSFSVSRYAQPASPGNSSNSDQKQVQNEAEKVVILQAQLELMRQYDQRLLDTVYWSLTTTGGIVLLVVGLGWYTNFRFYKRDLEDIRRDIHASLRQEISEIARETALSIARQTTDSAMRDFEEMQYQLLKLEADRYEKDDSISNAVYAYTRMLPLAQSVHQDLYAPEVLEETIRLLKKEKVLMHSVLIPKIHKALEYLPKEYSADVDTINQLIRTIRAK